MSDAFKERKQINYGEQGICFATVTHQSNEKCFATHWHDRMEILHIVEGSLEVWLGDEHSTACEGQVVIIMPHMTHVGIAGPEGLVCNMVTFECKTFLNDSKGSAGYILPMLQHSVCFCPVTDQPAIVQIMEELAFLMPEKHKYNPLYIQGKIYELLGLFYQYCVTQSRQLKKPDDRFDQVLSYVNDHYTENISTSEISRRFGYEEAYFCRRFKLITGITTRKYIRILRLEQAERMLCQSREDIKTIAAKCGFSDGCYFANCFRRHFGVTPKECRNGCKTLSQL